MNENYIKAKKLIKEGFTSIQDKLIEAMMDIKRTNPDLTHKEVMDIFSSEVEKFVKFHSEDRTELPITQQKNPSIRVLRDKMPIMKIPYGGKKQ
jgi:hypothetical protein